MSSLLTATVATILAKIIVDSARGNRNTILGQYIRAKQQWLTSPLPPVQCWKLIHWLGESLLNACQHQHCRGGGGQTKTPTVILWFTLQCPRNFCHDCSLYVICRSGKLYWNDEIDLMQAKYRTLRLLHEEGWHTYKSEWNRIVLINNKLINNIHDKMI